MNDALQEARKARGLSQADLANLLGTDQSNVSRYETGARKPSVAHQIKMARILGVSREDLFGEGAPVAVGATGAVEEEPPNHL